MINAPTSAAHCHCSLWRQLALHQRDVDSSLQWQLMGVILKPYQQGKVGNHMPSPTGSRLA